METSDPEFYFEDLEAGLTKEFGSYEVTEAEIIEFAEQYDPQWIHTDPEAAAESVYGGLIASGWHTTAICMRLMVDHHVSKSSALGGLGVEELRWPNPVRPGNELSVRWRVREKRVSENRPDRGIVSAHVRMWDQADEEKLEMKPTGLYALRDG